MIERNVPGAGRFTQQEVQGISRRSCDVLNDLGSQIQWVHSYVTDDKLYCLYIAPNEDLIREHARRGGFPADRVSEVRRQISPLDAISEGGRG